MELRFVPGELRKLDLTVSELLAIPLAEDELPPRGIAGLVDWRWGGALSQLLARGVVTGAPGEALLFPGRPKLGFDKVVCFGIGQSSAFNEQVYRVVLERMLDTVEGLGVRRAVVQLPGRATDAIAPERAAELLLERAAERSRHDTWTLIEGPEAQRVISQRLQRERRREWRP